MYAYLSASTFFFKKSVDLCVRCWDHFNTEMPSSLNINSHYKVKTVSWLSLITETTIHGKWSSYWNSAQNAECIQQVNIESLIQFHKFSLNYSHESPLKNVHNICMTLGTYSITWWCHQMATFSTLLALSVGNSPVNLKREALLFSLICVWINHWVNSREAGDLRRHPVHYEVIVMKASLDQK